MHITECSIQAKIISKSEHNQDTQSASVCMEYLNGTSCCEGLSFPTTNTAARVKPISFTEEDYQPFILCFLKLKPNLSPFLLYSQLLQTFYLGIWVFGATGISCFGHCGPQRAQNCILVNTLLKIHSPCPAFFFSF